MLTLSDTDSALVHASDAHGPVVQVASRTIPAGEDSMADLRMNVAYLRGSTGWVAAQTVEPVSSIDADNFSTHTEHPIALDAPVILNPLSIPKPWGQEIWFSGIEERGESMVSQGQSRLSLSAYLALAPNRLVRRAAPLLLKILDPKPTPEQGSLYFETHNTKHEVYVVTEVDRAAWPNGEGAIRLGMNQEKRKGYGSDKAFRAAYLSAVKRYEQIRRALDAASDNAGQNDRAAELEALAGAQLHREEHARRKEMESFTAVKKLRTGDVVQVSPHIPHSLQHGVRVFEFQTPTYERNIISFNQRVLTQDHWDSSYAIDNMSLAGPGEPTIDVLRNDPNLKIERIVNFDDFDVQRISLVGELPADLSDGYLMIAILKGALVLESAAGSVQLIATSTPKSSTGNAGQAGLMPAGAVNATFKTGSKKAVFLIARPKAGAAGTIPLHTQSQSF